MDRRWRWFDGYFGDGCLRGISNRSREEPMGMPVIPCLRDLIDRLKRYQAFAILWVLLEPSGRETERVFASAIFGLESSVTLQPSDDFAP